jgi:hypothetical protein
VRILDKQGLQDGCCECLSLFQASLSRLHASSAGASA